MSDNEIRGYVREKMKLPCWKEHGVHFVIDVAAMKFSLTEKQRVRLHETLKV